MQVRPGVVYTQGQQQLFQQDHADTTGEQGQRDACRAIVAPGDQQIGDYQGAESYAHDIEDF